MEVRVISEDRVLRNTVQNRLVLDVNIWALTRFIDL